MPDYSKCIIYTIRTPTGLYVGSTCNYTNRKYQHKSDIHNEKSKKYNYKLYNNIRENNDEWDMKPYSEFPCKNKMEMTIEEERVRRELNADLNSISCIQDKEKTIEKQKQYYQQNKEKLAENMKQYREENKEKIAEYSKKHYQENKEKIDEYAKKYRENNKEKIDEYAKKYYQDNKELISQNAKQYYKKNKEKSR